MTMFTITTLYAGLSAILFAFLSLRVSLRRRAIRQSIGSGGDKVLSIRIRQQANFAEYVPITLILMALAEAGGAAPAAMHGAGLLLVGTRLMHAVGMGLRRLWWLRTIGMTLCYLLIAGLGLALVGHSLVPIE